MSSRGGSKGLLIRLSVLIVIGAIAAVVALQFKSSVSEDEVRQMVRERELIGLTLAEAAKRLHSEAPETKDGAVEFEFDQVKDWKAGKLLVEVRDGRVFAAVWVNEIAGNDVRQTEGDGGDGGAAEGQGAPTGIRAKNQTEGGGGPR